MPRSPRQLTQLLESLQAGNDPSATDITAFSDLGKEEVEQVRGAWGRLPASIRELILVRAAELSEDNVDLDFIRLACIGLEDALPAIRRSAAEALWENEDPPAAERLAILVRDDPEASVRAAAAAALKPVVVQREFAAVGDALGDAVIDALRQAASRPTESFDVRATAIESLGPRDLPWVQALITDAYDDDDPRLRVAAVRAMGDSANDRWLEYLADQARSDDPAFRFEAATSIGLIGSEDGIEYLEELLDDEDTEVLLATVAALGEIGGEPALELLRDFKRRAPEGTEELVDEAIEAALFLAREGGNGQP
ncbi:MAG: HEAT repeat domain-containing protein [Chloroflexi bacterium]|nr:HEAT repeat domain-containing protein [Chloroflexota bacterium]